MITRRMGDKFEEFKFYFNTKFNEQKESLTKKSKQITKEMQHEVSKQLKQLNSENKMF